MMLKKNEFSNDIVSSKNVLLVPKLNSDQVVNFIKNIMFKNYLEEESTFKVIIESVKDVQLKEQKDWLFKVWNMRNNQSFNNINDKLNINDKTK